jgi:hypothetical protein
MAQKITAAAALNKSKLLDQVRDIIRRKHHSIRTEQALHRLYSKRFIRFHKVNTVAAEKPFKNFSDPG